VFWANEERLIVQWHQYTIEMRTKTPSVGSGKWHHIDLSISSEARNPRTVHGLLGQTHRPSTPKPGAEQGEGAIEVCAAAACCLHGSLRVVRRARLRTTLSATSGTPTSDSTRCVVSCAVPLSSC
jgi:hypothetical protein